MAIKIHLCKPFVIIAMVSSTALFSNFVFAGEIFGVNDQDIEIPDPGYAASAMETETFVDAFVRYVEVEFLIIHECWGDLTVWLTNGEGASYELFNGASNENGGELKIYCPIPDFFDGVRANGTWSLEVWDAVPNCSGYIEYWWLRIHYERPDNGYYYFRSDGEAECFFSTAVSGSPLRKRLDILRAFRDKYLLPSLAGRLLVSLYYHLGPKMSHLILRYPMLKKPAVIFTYLIIGAWKFILILKLTSGEYTSILVSFCLFILLLAQLGKLKIKPTATSHSGKCEMAGGMIFSETPLESGCDLRRGFSEAIPLLIRHLRLARTIQP